MVAHGSDWMGYGKNMMKSGSAPFHSSFLIGGGDWGVMMKVRHQFHRWQQMKLCLYFGSLQNLFYILWLLMLSISLSIGERNPNPTIYRPQNQVMHPLGLSKYIRNCGTEGICYSFTQVFVNLSPHGKAVSSIDFPPFTLCKQSSCYNHSMI